MACLDVSVRKGEGYPDHRRKVNRYQAREKGRTDRRWEKKDRRFPRRGQRERRD